MAIMKVFTVFLLLLLPLGSVAVQPITVTDDEQRLLSLNAPAKRIVSLSPHATELLFAAGATDQVIATVSFSDYPEQAKSITRIGSFQKIDIERLVSLQPDLVVAWRGGGARDQVVTIQQLGYPVFFSEPLSFQDVAQTVRSFGRLMGTDDRANEAASEFERRLKTLRQEYAQRQQVSVFYQVWNEPLITINGDHLISRVIELCGGLNVFNDLALRAPKVGLESVIAAAPDAIIIGVTEEDADWESDWYRWTSLQAVRDKLVFTLDADLIARQSPRIVQGARQMCEYLEQARQRISD